MRIRLTFVMPMAAVLLAAGLLMGCGGPAPATPTAEPPAAEPTAIPQEEAPTAVPTEPPAEEPTIAPTEPLAEEPTVAPTEAGPVSGEALLQERCSTCHSLDRVAAKSEGRAEWEQIVTRMIGNGAQLNEEEKALLIDYLAQTYGE